MGRKANIEEKDNKYFASRIKYYNSRDDASEALEWISADRIDKIEHGKLANPDEVLQMAKCYKNPSLCNYYCSQECPIGQVYVPAVESKPLGQITLEMLNALNNLNKTKDRFVEISVDGVVSPDEVKDFREIKKNLDNMSLVIDTLRLWIDNMIVSGQIDGDLVQ